MHIKIQVISSVSLAGMATNNKLPLFWSSWVQFPVQHDFPVSLSGLSERVDRGMKWIFAVMILDASGFGCCGFLILDLQVQILPDAGGGFVPRTNS